MIYRRGYIGLLEITAGTLSNGAAIPFSFVANSFTGLLPCSGSLPLLCQWCSVKLQGLLINGLLKGSLQHSKLQSENGKPILDSLKKEVLVTQKLNISFRATLNLIMKPNQKIFIFGYLLKSLEFLEVKLPWTVKDLWIWEGKCQYTLGEQNGLESDTDYGNCEFST